MSGLRYTFHPSPVGDLLIASSRKGLVRIVFYDDLRALADEGARTLGDLLGAAPFGAVADRGLNLEVCRQLDEYFFGDRRSFRLKLDMRAVRSTFARRVLKSLKKVPPGEVVTYSELARMAGNVRAARAVGQTMNRNPVPIVIPCHRVIGAGGSLGGYSGGLWRKELLLKHEGVLRDLPLPLAA